MPKSFAGTNKKSSSQSSEIDSSISAAEKSQNGSDATEEVNDSQISGSENMWESQAEMHQITGKLTRPKNFKSKAQLQREKVQREKAEKQRIREEILATTPVTDDDTGAYSTYLASKSSSSKSEVEIQEQKEKQALKAQQRKLDAKKSQAMKEA